MCAGYVEYIPISKSGPKFVEDEIIPPDKTVRNDYVVKKYKMGGEIVNNVLLKVISQCTVGASVKNVCEFGDKLILEETGKIFKKSTDMKKGIAFPTCVSVNHVISHYSPMESDYELCEGDVAKIELGAHIDGYISIVGHTIVIESSKLKPVSGRSADVITAAYTAAELMMRLIRPGKSSHRVWEKLKKVAESYNCTLVQDIVSPQLQQYSSLNMKAINQNPSNEQKAQLVKFDVDMFEVYAIDICVSTGKGVGKPGDFKTTVFRKTDDTYSPKLKTSRAFLREITNKYGNMTFHIRNCSDIAKARLGLTECTKHGIIAPYQVMVEKQMEITAQFKFTVLIMHDGTHKITGLPFESDRYQTEYDITDKEILDLLKGPVEFKVLREIKRKERAALKQREKKENTETDQDS